MTDLRDPQDRGLISLVIPVFNEEDGIDQLRERLGPVRAMWRDTADVEFVFVDDGSSDNTRHALHKVFGTDPLSQIAVHEVNRGIGAAFRTGFARSRGSIVCTIDADCSYGPENLQRLTVGARRAGCGYCRSFSISPAGHRGGRSSLAARSQQVVLGFSIASSRRCDSTPTPAFSALTGRTWWKRLRSRKTDSCQRLKC